jgi:hypothetical protein
LPILNYTRIWRVGEWLSAPLLLEHEKPFKVLCVCVCVCVCVCDFWSGSVCAVIVLTWVCGFLGPLQLRIGYVSLVPSCYLDILSSLDQMLVLRRHFFYTVFYMPTFTIVFTTYTLLGLKVSAEDFGTMEPVFSHCIFLFFFPFFFTTRS